MATLASARVGGFSLLPVDDFGDVFEGPGLEAVEDHLLPLEVLLDGEGRRLLVARSPITEVVKCKMFTWHPEMTSRSSKGQKGCPKRSNLKMTHCGRKNASNSLTQSICFLVWTAFGLLRRT